MKDYTVITQYSLNMLPEMHYLPCYWLYWFESFISSYIMCLKNAY